LGKNVEAKLFVSLKDFMLFFATKQAVTKRRLILSKLFPNMVLAWIPFLIWLAMPRGGIFHNSLFYYSIMSIMLGVGDYVDIFKAVQQMPKGSMYQFSGPNSYWYAPNGQNPESA